MMTNNEYSDETAPSTSRTAADLEAQRREYILEPASRLWDPNGDFEDRKGLSWIWNLMIARSVPPRRNLNRLKQILDEPGFGAEDNTAIDTWFRCFKHFVSFQEICFLLDHNFLMPFILQNGRGDRLVIERIVRVTSQCEERMNQLKPSILEAEEGFSLRDQSAWAVKAATRQLRIAFAEYYKQFTCYFDCVEMRLPQ
eukprot:scaffold550815_cov44-Prasinocladus_malaysianus.AAC.1